MDAVKPLRIGLLGLAFDDAGREAVVARLLARPKDAPFGYVVTPNADHFARLARIPGLRPVYHGAELCLLDSQFLGHCARGLGLARPPVVPGADLTQALLARLDGARVAVIGMGGEAFAALAARYPKIRFLHHAPPMGLLHDAAAFFAARDFAAESRAAFVFIALGAPVQELLAYAIARRGGAVGLGLCIGSALDFCAGSRARAPVWMRRAGLEWLHRLWREPFRLGGRYLLDDPRVLLSLVRARWP